MTTRLWAAIHSPPGLLQAAIAELQREGPAIARAADAQIIAGLASVWQAGYGPLDLMHLLRRTQTAVHTSIATAAIVADHQARGAPAGAWDDQVGQVAAEHAAAPTTVATLGAAVQLLVLLPCLAPIPPTLHPLGGDAAASAASGDRLQGLDDQVLARVRALLHKAESTTFEAEAEALTAKAQQLITRHAIDEARLQSSGTTGAPPVTRRILLDDPYLSAKSLLVHQVAAANRCHAVFSRHPGWSTVFGTDADVQATQLLVASLLAQAVGTMARLGPQRDVYGRSRTRSFRSAFLQGFAVRIGERLDQTSTDVLAGAADRDRVLPVLAGRQADARAAADEAFPQLVNHSLGISNGEGWFAGKAAADLASLDVTAGSVGP
ncbi:MAG TPA: DUF2786 domain-containing protein [Euzebya sp.]|nr:DUF2786 domain-containing protein [Euzebya sp.]